jgi:hypothetical protein
LKNLKCELIPADNFIYCNDYFSKNELGNFVLPKKVIYAQYAVCQFHLFSYVNPLQLQVLFQIFENNPIQSFEPMICQPCKNKVAQGKKLMIL